MNVRRTYSDISRIDNTIVQCLNEKSPINNSIKKTKSKGVRNSLMMEIILSRFGWSDANQTLIRSFCEGIDNAQSFFKSIFIYGRSGCGKSELLKDMKKLIGMDKKIIVQSAQSFSRSFSLALKNSEIDQFRKKYRGTEILFIDDFHSFCGKRQSSNEFLHTFDALQKKGTVIVLVSARKIAQLSHLSKSIRSRLEGMLFLEMEQAPLPYIRNIVQSKLLKQGLYFPEPVVTDMARSCEGNFQHIDPMMKKIQKIRKSLFYNRSYEEIKKLIKPFLPVIEDSLKDFTIIVNKVCDAFGVSAKELCSKKRDKLFIKARYLCLFYGVFFQFNKQKIASFFGYKSLHSVQIACKRCEEWQKEDETFRKLLRQLMKNLDISLKTIRSL